MLYFGVEKEMVPAGRRGWGVGLPRKWTNGVFEGFRNEREGINGDLFVIMKLFEFGLMSIEFVFGPVYTCGL